jgi:hypothetical protein
MAYMSRTEPDNCRTSPDMSARYLRASLPGQERTSPFRGVSVSVRSGLRHPFAEPYPPIPASASLAEEDVEAGPEINNSVVSTLVATWLG